MNQEVYFIIFNDEFIQWYSASELVQNNQLLSSVLKTALSNEFVFNIEAEGYTVGYTASDISISLNKQHVRNRAVLQTGDLVTLKSQNRTCHILFIKDNKAVKNFNEMFNDGINNSYRINNARFMLLREKFFKNFVQEKYEYFWCGGCANKL